MAGAPPGQKRKRDELAGARKRRRTRASVEGDSSEAASSLGGVSAFKDVWGVLSKAGWKSKRPAGKSLDPRFKYVRPGGKPDGEEGKDYLLGELAVLRYIGTADQVVVTSRLSAGPLASEARTAGVAIVDGVVSEVGSAGADGVAGEEAVGGRGARGRGARGGRSARAGRGERPARRVGSATGAGALDGDVADVVERGVGGRGQVAAVSESLQPGRSTPMGAPVATTPSRTPPIMLQDVYVGKLVAFSPDKERWMKSKVYRPIGTAYIIGRVYRLVKKGKNANLFEIRWLDSQFQSAVEHISVGVMQLGIKHYIALTRVKQPDWRLLIRPDPTDEIDFEEEDSDCEEEVLEPFDPTEALPTSLAEVEAIRSMRFIPSGELRAFVPVSTRRRIDAKLLAPGVQTFV